MTFCLPSLLGQVEETGSTNPLPLHANDQLDRTGWIPNSMRILTRTTAIMGLVHMSI